MSDKYAVMMPGFHLLSYETQEHGLVCRVEVGVDTETIHVENFVYKYILAVHTGLFSF